MLDKLPNTKATTVSCALERIKTIPGYPGDERIEKGPVVVIECDEDIPCNPCEDICPREAITVGEPITNLPRIDPVKVRRVHRLHQHLPRVVHVRRAQELQRRRSR